VTARTRTARVELHRILGRSRGFGASSRRRVRPKPGLPLRSSPLDGHDRGRACPPGHFRVSGSLAASPKRGGWLAVLPKAASHLRFTEVSRGCKTRSVGYGRLLPWGSVPFGVSVRAIVVSVCLTDTIRSRGFSPSQRFEPAWTSWLCFAPHPPLGFGNGLRSFSHSASRDASRRPLLSCRFGWLGHLSSELELYLCPCFRLHRAAFCWPFASSSADRATPPAELDISSGFASAEAVAGPRERSEPLTGRRARFARRDADGSLEATWSSFRQARACDFRALLRLRVRTRASTVRRSPEPMLP